MTALSCNVYRAWPMLTDNFDGIAWRCPTDHNYGFVTVDIDERECECRVPLNCPVVRGSSCDWHVGFLAFDYVGGFEWPWVVPSGFMWLNYTW